MHNQNKITILGCGNGGMALAADLKLKGAKVAIWADPGHVKKFNVIKQSGKIIISEAGRCESARIDLITHNLLEAVNFGDVIYNCTPMVAHVSLFRKIATYVSKINVRKIIVNLSGVFSSVDQLLNSRDKKIFNKLKVYDTSSFPYACRAGEGNNVTIMGRKSELIIAPLFPSDSYYFTELHESILPSSINMVENTFKLGLSGTNAVYHPATVLFNARLIDNGCTFLFYKEGISKRTSLLHEALDNERLMLAKSMGYALMPGVEDDNKYYGTNFRNNYEFSLHSDVHKKIKSPETLEHRFVTEDIAYGLVPLIALGKLYNVAMPNIESVINIFSTIMGVDYYQGGRNFSSLDKKLIREISHISYLPSCLSA